MAPDYDFWLVDLDGTLVDVEWGYIREVFDRVGDRLGRSFSDEEAAVLWHGLTDSRDRQLERWGIDRDAFWSALDDAEEPRVRAEQTYLHDDAAFVAGLDDPVGVVTHCQEPLCGPVLEHLDIGDWFDAVVTCCDEVGWKPDAAPVERAMADLGVLEDGPAIADGGSNPAGVLAGDGPCDVGAAWNAGLDAIHVERVGPERRGQCVWADHRIESFDELV